MKTYCRKDIMDFYSISRRVIEGYENKHLIKPLGRNEKGVLIYDETTFKRIGFIRLSQKLGFKVKEIKKLLNLSDKELKKELIKQLKVLDKKKEDIEYLVSILNDLINTKNLQLSNKIIQIFKEEKK